MPRPRSFSEDTVLETVMTLFWEKGYTATSMKDIQSATGLKAGSLYDAFGDKRHLFIQAMARYRKAYVGKRLHKLQLPGPAPARLKEFFDDLIEFSLGEGRKLGCLMSNTAVELAPHDPEMKGYVQDNLVDIADAFCAVIEEGQQHGQIQTRDDPADLARFLVSTLQGIRVLAKAGTSEDTLRVSARVALQALAC